MLTLSGNIDKEAKDKIRREWEEIHSGADKAFRIAVLDLGMQYAPIGVSQRDAQFVESKAVTVEDIARFFGVPLHKLMAGKQAYNSNEQNSIEYVNGTISPIAIQCNQEDTAKLLFDSEIARGMRVKRNLLAELQGDVRSRAEWYKACLLYTSGKGERSPIQLEKQHGGYLVCHLFPVLYLPSRCGQDSQTGDRPL